MAFIQKIDRRTALAAGAAAALSALARPARAAFPDRPVTVVVPFPPGGPNDIIGRIAGNAIETALKTQAIVENRPGAGGALALGTVARGAADGYTVVLPSGVSYVTQPALMRDVAYRVDAFRPATIVAGGPSVLALRKGLKVKSVKDLIDLAKYRPGELTYGSSGVGTTLHLGGELFKAQAGVDIVHVPYKGTSEVVLDLAGGRIDMSFISPLNARKLADDGRIVALATTGTGRMKGWEETPTVAENGLAGYELDSWYPLLAPKDAPDDKVRALREAVAAGLKTPDAISRLADLGFTPVGSTPEDAATFIAVETEKWGQLIRQSRLSVD